MAAFDTTRPAHIVPAGMISGYVQRTFASIIAWNDTRVTRKALGQLSNRELDDIGLTRGEIDSVARRTF